ncbi:uncharacterized protein LOC131884585 [Tigriopus californicus]|uniref:uncharacterized protein LOC131884585 n=1 Tax=Tigriopus californicus TaxID=6832 RepID=UPI0027DA309D|nr:uncharacterized protein LOC131884585 [Tigriopus californicus]
MHDHKLLREAFDTMAEAIQWYQAQELDRHFRVRDSRHDAYQYKVFRCSQRVASKAYKHAKTRKIYPCRAKITVRQIEMCHCEATEPRERCFQARHRFIMEGCLTHSHPMDPDNFRLSQVTQERILGLIQSGHEVNEIVDLCNADQSQSQSKRVTLAHVYRLKRAMDRAPSKASTSKIPLEESKFIQDITRLEDKLATIKEVMTSQRVKMEDKRILMQSLKIMPLKDVVIPQYPDLSLP